MSNRFASRLALAAGAACAAGVAVWLFRREPALRTAPVPVPRPDDASTNDFDEPAPDSFTFEPEPESLRFSAQPAERGGMQQLLDDYGALSPEELGAAFLAGATDTAIDEPPRSTAETSGFQIFDHHSPDYGPDESVSDEELASLYARHA